MDKVTVIQHATDGERVMQASLAYKSAIVELNKLVVSRYRTWYAEHVRGSGAEDVPTPEQLDCITVEASYEIVSAHVSNIAELISVLHCGNDAPIINACNRVCRLRDELCAIEFAIHCDLHKAIGDTTLDVL